MNIVFIGAGNLATNLAKELFSKSFNIVQIYSRTVESAKLLAEKVEASYTNNIKEVDTDADLYVFSVKDSVLDILIKEIPPNKGLWVHTSGSIPMSIFGGYTNRYGVLYPFQTFSKDRVVGFKEIPLFIETNSDSDLSLLKGICENISQKIYNLSSEKRKYIHLTGVFACNFVNHMYTIANGILKEQDIPFEVLLPLIDETAAKVHTMTPQTAQTGPAIRYDENIINKHVSLIEDPLLKSIYTLMSESIHKNNK